MSIFYDCFRYISTIKIIVFTANTSQQKWSIGQHLLKASYGLLLFYFLSDIHETLFKSIIWVAVVLLFFFLSDSHIHETLCIPRTAGRVGNCFNFVNIGLTTPATTIFMTLL